ncbi:MAG: iron ABC transporter permease [Ezakiella sp.]|nr:iron ABC transporter permease [Ezakiella sp.]
MDKKKIILFLFVLMIVAFVMSIALGAINFSFKAVFSSLFSSEATDERLIVVGLRLPRAITGALVGMALAVSGALLQGIMRNHLASPSVIGVTNGASFVGHLVLIAFPTLAYLLPIGSIFGALATTLFIYVVAYQDGVNPNQMILSGVAISAVFTAFNNLIKSVYSDRIVNIVGFLVGSLNGTSWATVKLIAPYILVGLFLALLMSYKMNILLLGDDVSSSLGLRVENFRFLMIVVSSLLSGAAISAAGLISFVGLIVPHIARLIVGSDYRYLTITSALMGASFVMLADTIGRVVLPIGELSVSIVIAIFGAPFFLFLLRKSYRS